MAVELNLGKIKKTDAELKADVQDIVGEMGGAGGGEINVLWENPNPNLAYASVLVTLNDSLEKYKFISFVTVVDKTYKQLTSSGWVPIDLSLDALWVEVNSFKYGAGVVVRTLMKTNAQQPDKIQINQCAKFSSFTGASQTTNDYLIPYMILGYK